jgi:uncharacterized protein YegJ (DUF2314 family)
MFRYDPNVQLVCPRCRKPDSRYFDVPLDWFVGRCVKIAFQSQDGLVEHMWVVVTGVEDGRLVGELDNDPLFVEDIECGDRVVLDRTQIEVVKHPLDEGGATEDPPPVVPPTARFGARCNLWN